MKRRWLAMVMAGFTVIVGGCVGTVSSKSMWRLEEGREKEGLTVPVPGKITVLDFWASWCEPCIEAMPELETLWGRMDRSRVAVVGVSADETRSAALGSFDSVNTVTFPMVWDRYGALREMFGVTTFPAIVLIDRNGRIAWSAGGLVNPTVKSVPPEELTEQVEHQIERLLNE